MEKVKKWEPVTVVKKWEVATEELTKAFVKKYFPELDCEEDGYWIGDEIGGIYHICDMFFNVERMREALELGATYEQLTDFDDMEAESLCSPLKVNFRNFVQGV